MEWLEVISDLNVSLKLNQKVSSIILLAYIVGYVSSGKGAFISAFIFSEILCTSSMLDSFTNVNYYLVFVAVYCGVYNIANKERVATRLAIYSAAALSTGMAIDAKLYPQSETLLYQNYELLFMVVHVLIILTTSRFRLQRVPLSRFIRVVSRCLATSYNASYIWYTVKNQLKTSTPCHLLKTKPYG